MCNFWVYGKIVLNFCRAAGEWHNTSYFYIFFAFIYCMFAHVCATAHMWKSENNFQKWVLFNFFLGFFLSILCILKIKLRLSALKPCTFTHWVISPVLQRVFYSKRHWKTSFRVVTLKTKWKQDQFVEHRTRKTLRSIRMIKYRKSEKFIKKLHQGCNLESRSQRD